MPEIQPTPIYRLRVKRWFDLQDGSVKERYYLDERITKGFFRKRHAWSPARVWAFDTGGGSKEPVSGDRKWAKKIAAEFGIKMPR